MSRELAKVTYKDGWHFHLYNHPNLEGTWIAITVAMPDAYHPTETTTVCIRSAVPPIPDKTYFFEWLRWRIHIAETHEVNEWFKVGGVAIYDPHAPGANDEKEDDVCLKQSSTVSGSLLVPYPVIAS